MTTKRILLIPVFVAAAVGLGGLAVRELWNAVMPQLADGIHTINFWTAMGLLLLCRILVGGWGGGHHKKHMGKEGAWEHMSAINFSDKARMKEYWRTRCAKKAEQSADELQVERES
jgi:hypothetical protein